MRELLVVSFYTPNGDYPEHAARLQSECEALGLDYRIEERPDTGSYLGNCRKKANYIQGCLYGFLRPLLWVDVDSTILRAPTGIREDVDFMGRAKPHRDERAWHVDVMYFNATRPASDLVDLWVEHLTDHSDEHAFDAAWKSGRWQGSWSELPAEYADAPGGVVTFRRSRSPEKRAAHKMLRARRAGRC